MHIDITPKFNAGDTAYFILPDLMTVQTCKVKKVFVQWQCDETGEPQITERYIVYYADGLTWNIPEWKHNIDTLFYSERQALDSLFPKE